MDELPTLEAALAEANEIQAWFDQAQAKNARLNWLNGFIAHAQAETRQNGSEPIPQG